MNIVVKNGGKNKNANLKITYRKNICNKYVKDCGWYG